MTSGAQVYTVERETFILFDFSILNFILNIYSALFFLASHTNAFKIPQNNNESKKILFGSNDKAFVSQPETLLKKKKKKSKTTFRSLKNSKIVYCFANSQNRSASEDVKTKV